MQFFAFSFFQTGAIGHGQIDIVFDRTGGHYPSPGLGDQIGRADDQVGTQQGQHPGRFRKPPVVADHRPDIDIPLFILNNKKTGVSRIETIVFFVKKMRFTINIWIFYFRNHDQTGVKKMLLMALGKTGHYHRIFSPGHILEKFAAGSVHRFSGLRDLIAG